MIIDMLEAFEAEGIRYVVVGGVAAIAHGASRRTGDLDVCYETSEANVELLAVTVNRWNPHLRVSGDERLPFPLDRRSLAELQTLTLDTDQGALDLLQTVLGIGSYEDCVGESVSVPVGDISVRMLGLEALIRAKEATARGKDLKALPELREALVELKALRTIHAQRRVDPRTLEPASVAPASALTGALRQFASERASFLDGLRSGARTPPASFLTALASVRQLAAEPDEVTRLAPEMRPLLHLATTEAQRWKRHLPDSEHTL
jgi:hypothetical protein